MQAPMTFPSARGFTLIEMVVTLVLVGILAVIGLPILSNSARAYSATQESLATLGKLRYATERLAREIREVRRDPLAPGDYDIAVMTATTFQFTRADGVEATLEAAPPRLTLRYSAPVANPPPALTDQVAGFAFKYFKADGVTAATSKSDVAFVEMNLTLTQGGADYAQRTRMSLRNKL